MTGKFRATSGRANRKPSTGLTRMVTARSLAKSSATPRAIRADASIKWTRTMTGKFPATNGRAIRNDSTASTPMATGRSRKKRFAAPARTDLKDRRTERQREGEKEGQRDDLKRRTMLISLSLCLSVSLSFCSGLLLLDLLPILKEIGQADVGQRVFEQLLYHLERHGGDVRAEPRRFDHVQRVADAGRQNLGVKSVVVVNLPNLPDQSHAFVADVVQAADEGADESRSRFR